MNIEQERKNLDSFTKKTLENVNNKFVEKCTELTVYVVKSQLEFIKSSGDVEILADLTKYLINDFMDYMLENCDRVLTSDEIDDINEKSLQKFLIDLENLTKTLITKDFETYVGLALGNIGLAFIEEYENQSKLKNKS